MAVELSQEVVERIHEELEYTIPAPSFIIYPTNPYYGDFDYSKYLHLSFFNGNYKDHNAAIATLLLLILAAEEELDGYPMEAINEEVGE